MRTVIAMTAMKVLKVTKTKPHPPRVYNFGAGPACVPQEVLNQIVEDIPDWYDGMSVMEISHRLPVFQELTQNIEADLRTLLAIPDDFAVLFMPGGARTQYSIIPLNLLKEAKTADYLVSGHWSELAFQDAKKYCQPHLVSTGKNEGYVRIPDQEQWSYSKDGAYFHYVDNETIHGVEFPHPPKGHGKWLVSDMTSNILSKPIDFSSFGLIYASAQKNLGIAGITLIIVRKELLGGAHPFTPATLDYTVCEQAHAMYNTPPVFNWYVLGLIVKWALAQGGISRLAADCEHKAKLVYDVIDNSQFYINPVFKPHRSRINIPFRLQNAQLELLFLQEASEACLKQLSGHKAVGACRASLYNAMPLTGVQALVEFMQAFEKKYA